MQPLRYDLRGSAAKDISRTRATTTARSIDAATPLRSAETELECAIGLRAVATVNRQRERGREIDRCIYIYIERERETKK